MTETHATTHESQPPSRPALTFDPQEFCHYLADSDWTQEQKVEFIEALWQIVVSFVDLGFDLHPVQRVIDTSSILEMSCEEVTSLQTNTKLEPASATLCIAAAGDDL